MLQSRNKSLSSLREPLLAPPADIPLDTLSVTVPQVIVEPRIKVEIKQQESEFEKLIVSSTLFDPNTEQQAKNISRAFNKRVRETSIFESDIRGNWIPPGSYLLVTRNGIPEMRLSAPRKLKTPLITGPGTRIEEKGIFKLTETYVNAGGTHILNVPRGKLAYAWEAGIPKIYGEGPHVIHDPTFSFNPDTGLMDRTLQYIHHGNLHILTVPAGKIAKVWEGRTARLLYPSPLKMRDLLH